MNNGPSKDPTAVNGLDGRDLLRALLDTLPDLIYVKDTESRYVIDNVGHAKTLGAAKPEEIAGKTDFDFYPRELAERYRAEEQEIVSSGRPLFDKKEPGVDEKGNERLLSSTKLPLRDDSGKIVGLVGVTREATEREEAEQAFEESEERYRRLVESAPEAIAILGEEGEIVFINAAGARIVDADDPEELIGKPYLDFVHPDFRETARARVLQSQEGKTAQLLQEKLLRLDGSPVEVEVVIIPTTYEGKPAAQSIIKDITERKEAERKLRESEERFRALVQNASDIVTTLDAEGVVRYKSPAVERILGYREEEMLGDSVFDYIHPEDVEQAERTFAEVWKAPGFIHPYSSGFGTRTAPGATYRRSATTY